MALISPGGGSGGGGALSSLASSVLSSPAATIDFSAIVQTSNHLRLMCVFRTDNAAASDSVLMRFNNDSGANYDRIALTGVNATASAGSASAGTSLFVANCPAASATASHFGVYEIVVPVYTGSSAKMCYVVGGAIPVAGTSTNYEADVNPGSWRTTSAITRITFLPSAGTNFVTGSAVYLYGLT